MTRRPAAIPDGSWPLEMPAKYAAGYCGEVSVDAFLAKVSKGIYCQPRRQAGCPDKWHKAKLDADINRRHGLTNANSPMVEDLGDLIR